MLNLSVFIGWKAGRILPPEENDAQLKGILVLMPILPNTLTTLLRMETPAKALWLTAPSAHAIKPTRICFSSGARRSRQWLG